MQIPDGREHRSIQQPAERRSTNHRSTEGIAHPAKRGAAERTHVAERCAEEGVVERRPSEWRTCEERVVRKRRVEVAEEGVEELEGVREHERATEVGMEERIVRERIVHGRLSALEIYRLLFRGRPNAGPIIKLEEGRSVSGGDVYMEPKYAPASSPCR